MERYVPEDKIQLSIVGSPAYRPNISLVANCSALLNLGEEDNENAIKKSGGGSDIYRMGPGETNGSLIIKSASREDAEIIEEMRLRGIPVYIYPRIEGSVRCLMPLVRGIGTDPVDDITVTQALTLAADTTLYMIEGDASTGYHLRAVAASSFNYMRGVAASNCEVTGFPAGHGYASMRPAKNFIPDSAFATWADAPYIAGEWSFSGGVFDTTVGSKASPWHDGLSMWLYTTASTLEAPTFVLNNVTTAASLSFFYRVSGTLQVTIDYGGGTTEVYTILSGSGYFNDVTSESGSFAAVNILFTLTTGEYAEIAAPQLIHIEGEECGQYRAVIMGSGNAVQGELTAASLKIESAIGFGMDVWPTQFVTADIDGVVCVSGLFQSLATSIVMVNHSTIAFVDNTLAAAMGDFELRFGSHASAEKFILLAGGTVRDSVTVTGHRLGDVYGWVLYSGYNANTGGIGAKMVRLRDGAEYTATSGAETLAFPNRIHIGCRTTAGYNAQGIIGAVTVSSCLWSEAGILADKLGDYGQVDYWRRLLGRKMRFRNTLSPKGVNREFWENTLPFFEIEAI